jgi:hypothetical protein
MKTTQPNIIVSTYGNGIAVGIIGTREQAEPTFNRFFNWGAAANETTYERTSGDSVLEGDSFGDSYLHELSPSFHYFLSTEEAMVKAMAAQNLANWQDTAISKQYKGNRQNKKQSGAKFRSEAIKAACDEYESFTKENFMLYKKSEVSQLKVLDGGAPTWDSSAMTFGEKALGGGYKSRLANA